MFAKGSGEKSTDFTKETLPEKGTYSELFWSVFPRIRTEYGEILRIFPCLVQMRENTGQDNSECGHFIRSESEIREVFQKSRSFVL